MLIASDAFLDSLEKWLKAVRAEDFESARFYAKHLVTSGELLAIHPEFVRCFCQHCEGFEPKLALFHFCQFLLCATDGRARGLKQYVKDNKPEVV